MEALAKIQPILLIVIAGGQIISLVISGYKGKRDPDEANKEAINKAQGKIAALQQALAERDKMCDVKHLAIGADLSLIKNNHLAHIEDTLGKQENSITRIFTILEERLPKRD